MSSKPHVLIIMTDQQRADCLGCAGHPQLRTPQLDRIAREGAMFNQAATVSPLCMPARISFATGLYPHEHGVWGNQGALREHDETLFQVLQREGYSTALVGKAHYYEHRAGMDLRDREPYMHARGFDYVHEVPGPFGSGIVFSYVSDEWKRKGVWETARQDLESRSASGGWLVRPSPLGEDEHLDGYVGGQAVSFIDAYRDSRPMCLFVGFPGPHDPWDAPGRFATMYSPRETPTPIAVPPVSDALPRHVRRSEAFRAFAPESLALIPEIRANYYGKISFIDEQVGRILSALERKGWLDRTLIVFLGDHGEMLGDHGRLRKGTFHESSVRIPLLMRWPEQISAGLVCDATTESIDVLPTVVEAAGGRPPARSRGRSLWPLLRGTAEEVRAEQLSEVEHGSQNQTMVRTREHKLAVEADGRSFMLFDLENDPQEQRNLAGDPAAKDLERGLLHRLRSRLERSRSPSAHPAHASGGFTLIELSIALVLLALMASMLYGSLSLAGMSWDRGEAKAQQGSEMRLTEDFLRRTLTAQHPLRMHKVVEQPLYFQGASDKMAYAAALPGRAGAGMYYFNVAVTANGDDSRLTLSRLIPDYAATSLPDFGSAEFSVLADHIAEVHFQYLGRDAGALATMSPTWRDRWDDTQRLPDLIRIDVKPVRGDPWPTLMIEPRLSLEVGCAGWNPVAQRCS